MVAAEDYRPVGLGSEIAATAAETLADVLGAPVLRLGAPFAPVPHSPTLLGALSPSSEDVELAARRAVKLATAR